MIDAYEIGIQLLLQDDVTSGLAVINRGLAEVDRAISATSAHLAGFVQEADRAAKAVAATLSGGATRPTRNQPVTGDTAAENATILRWGEEAKAEPVAAPGPERNDGSLVAIEKPSAPTAVTVLPVATAQDDRGMGQSGSSSVSAAPTNDAGNRMEVGGREPTGAGVSSVPQSAEREQVAPTPQAFVGTRNTNDPAAPTVAAAPQIDLSAGSQVAVTASIQRGRVEEASARSRAAAPSMTRAVQPAARELPVAPWAGVGTMRGGGGGQAIGMGERAAAPALPARESGGGGGGTVMLDGRLVGQWLADHMGREASRPPSGTSFFDPRQTPAWTVSGAL